MTPIEKFMSEYNPCKPLGEQIAAVIREAAAEEREAIASMVHRMANGHYPTISQSSVCLDIACLIRARKDNDHQP